MCNKRRIKFAKEPAALEVGSASPTHRTEAGGCSDRLPGDAFAMRQLEEPFPSISLESDDVIAISKHGAGKTHPDIQQNHAFFFMSPQARRVKRRRRGNSLGYLVRCLEARSLPLLDDSLTDQHGAEHDEQHCSRGRLNTQTDSDAVSMDTEDFQSTFGSSSLSEALAQSSRSNRSNTTAETIS